MINRTNQLFNKLKTEQTKIYEPKTQPIYFLANFKPAQLESQQFVNIR